MREILFKARRIDDGEWIEGYYLQNTDSEDCFIVSSLDWEVYSHCHYLMDTEVYNVVPDTLCQFTGMIDKKGKRIWEGDKCLITRTCICESVKIIWRDACFWAMDGFSTLIRLCDLEKDGYEIEVIS